MPYAKILIHRFITKHPSESDFDYMPLTGFFMAASPLLSLFTCRQAPVYGREGLASCTAPFLSVLYLLEEAFQEKSYFPLSYSDFTGRSWVVTSLLKKKNFF